MMKYERLTERLAFRVRASERETLQAMAERLRRSESGVLRLLIAEAALAMRLEAEGASQGDTASRN